MRARMTARFQYRVSAMIIPMPGLRAICWFKCARRIIGERYIQAAMVIAVSAAGMAMNTPTGPMFMVFAKKYARGIWKNQKPKKFIMVGVRVSPAPLNAFAYTMPMP